MNVPPPGVSRGNLFAALPLPGASEHFDILFASPHGRIERIVSHGHCSPPDAWYDQADDEWVVLLRGSATLAFGDGRRLTLEPGDWVGIPAHCRHRVESTGPQTLWLAVHYRGEVA